jgi:hypothetical protein
MHKKREKARTQKEVTKGADPTRGNHLSRGVTSHQSDIILQQLFWLPHQLWRFIFAGRVASKRKRKIMLQTEFF